MKFLKETVTFNLDIPKNIKLDQIATNEKVFRDLERVISHHVVLELLKVKEENFLGLINKNEICRAVYKGVGKSLNKLACNGE